MAFFSWLQHSAFSMWIVQSDSIWAYPSILTAHTVGLAMLVGAAAVVDLRLLGVAPDMPIAQVDGLYRFVWAGFYINLISGLLLFASEAADKATQPVFLVKLTLVFAALITTVRIRSAAAGTGTAAVPTRRLKRLAGTSLFLWAAAITAGRLMAYFK